MKYPKSPMLFDCFDPDCGAALIIAVAEAMSVGLNDDQMNVLGTFLSAVADTISYMAAQIEYNERVCRPKRGSEDYTNDEDEKTDDSGSEDDSDKAAQQNKKCPEKDYRNDKHHRT